jgi:hypothetical protein
MYVGTMSNYCLLLLGRREQQGQPPAPQTSRGRGRGGCWWLELAGDNFYLLLSAARSLRRSTNNNNTNNDDYDNLLLLVSVGCGCLLVVNVFCAQTNKTNIIVCPG